MHRRDIAAITLLLYGERINVCFCMIADDMAGNGDAHSVFSTKATPGCSAWLALRTFGRDAARLRCLCDGKRALNRA